MSFIQRTKGRRSNMKASGKGDLREKVKLLVRIVRGCMDEGDPEDQKAVMHGWLTGLLRCGLREAEDGAWQ